MTISSSSSVLRTLLAALVVAQLTVSSGAHAEPTGADVESARALYKEGKALRERGNLPAALERFHGAYALVPTPITALELGLTFALLGMPLEAREALLSIERMPVRADESQKAADARVQAHKLFDGQERRIAEVLLRLAPAPKSPAHVTIDSVPLLPEALSVARKVNPGKHTIVATVDGARAEADVELGEGESRVVVLRFEAQPGAAAEPRSAPMAYPERVPKREPDIARVPVSRSPLLYVGLGTGALGVAVGSAAGILALSKAATVMHACDSGVCPRAEESDLRLSRSMGTLSTLAFVVGGVGLAMGVAAWIWGGAPSPPARRTRTRAAPFIAVDGGGLSGQF